MKKSIMLTILLSCALQAAATVYVYKDAKGNMVYSDLPLYHLQEVKKEEPDIAPVPAQTTAQKTPAKKNLTPEEYNKQVAEQNKAIAEKNKQIDEANRKNIEENKKRQEEDKKSADQVNAANCKIARKNLENAQEGRQANKEQAIKDAREQVNLLCK